MKTSLLLVPFALLFTASSGTAGPPPPESCCACVASLGAQTAAPAPPLVPALFCELITSQGERVAFQSRCDARHGADVCVAQVANADLQDDLDCRALLAGERITCPGATPAPVAGQPALAGLVAALVGVGVWAARRRLSGART